MLGSGMVNVVNHAPVLGLYTWAVFSGCCDESVPPRAKIRPFGAKAAAISVRAVGMLARVVQAGTVRSSSHSSLGVSRKRRSPGSRAVRNLDDIIPSSSGTVQAQQAALVRSSPHQMAINVPGGGFQSVRHWRNPRSER